MTKEAQVKRKLIPTPLLAAPLVLLVLGLLVCSLSGLGLTSSTSSSSTESWAKRMLSPFCRRSPLLLGWFGRLFGLVEPSEPAVEELTSLSLLLLSTVEEVVGLFAGLGFASTESPAPPAMHLSDRQYFSFNSWIRPLFFSFHRALLNLAFSGEPAFTAMAYSNWKCFRRSSIAARLQSRWTMYSTKVDSAIKA